MMLKQKNFLLLLCCLVFSGFGVYALDYDYSYTHKCLGTPLKPQYDGGIVVNPKVSDGLNGWSTFGGSKIETRVSEDGNKFVVAFNRKGVHDGLSQTFNLEKDKLYTISAWVQVSHGKAEVSAMLKTQNKVEHAGSTIARAGCWSMLKGGLDVDESSPAHLFFMSKNQEVEIWVDSISLQPFTQEEWKSHQDKSIEKVRKRKVKIQALDGQGKALSKASLKIKQKNADFPLGCALSPQILNNTAYQNWFTSRFKLTVFENEMKWYINEPSQGQEDYSLADAMLNFTKSHNIIVRGHNIVWENPQWLPSWVTSLSPSQLSAAVDKRINSIVTRFSGQVIHWDGDNESIHFSFLTDKLGKNASAGFYTKAHQIDDKPLLFLNEIDTIERQRIRIATPAKYLKKIKEMRSYGYNGPLGIGLEGHFDVPNLAYMRAGIDVLASAHLPIWITELDVANTSTVGASKVGIFMDMILREAHAHPAISGIMIWSPWQPQGCYKMCLTDNNFKNLRAGDVVDNILQEWRNLGLTGITDDDGYFETSLFHGDYEMEITHPAIQGSLVAHRFKVKSGKKTTKTLSVKVKLFA